MVVCAIGGLPLYTTSLRRGANMGASSFSQLALDGAILPLYMKPKRYKTIKEHKDSVVRPEHNDPECSDWEMCFEMYHSPFCWVRTRQVER